MNGLQDALLNLALILITGAVSVVSAKVTQYFKEKGVLAKFEAKKESVNIAVNAVEQIALIENVPHKYNEAKRRAITLLQTQGIVISDAELDSLIEAAVSGLKQGYEKINKE